MVQVKLAILFDDSFRMKRLHNGASLILMLRFGKGGKGAFGDLREVGIKSD